MLDVVPSLGLHARAAKRFCPLLEFTALGTPSGCRHKSLQRLNKSAEEFSPQNPHAFKM